MCFLHVLPTIVARATVIDVPPYQGWASEGPDENEAELFRHSRN